MEPFCGEIRLAEHDPETRFNHDELIMISAPNPYESPQAPPQAQRAKLPLVVLFGICTAIWAFFGVLMALQFYDEAAGYVPREVMEPGGAAVVVAGFLFSSFYLWRAIGGWPRE